MKGNARIFVFLGIITFIVVFILLNMTLFTVKDITVLNKVESQLIDKEGIIKNSGINIGDNIFLMSENKAIELIEVTNPYLEVTSIERAFPDDVIIHVTVRTPIMAIKVKDAELYAIIDGSLKILEIIDTNNVLYNASAKISGIEVTSPVVGNTLDTSNTFNSRLATIAYVAENEKLDEASFLNFFQTISFVPESDAVCISLRSGVTICIFGGEEVENKLRYALEEYRYLGEQSYKRTRGYIYFDTQHGWSWSEDRPY